MKNILGMIIVMVTGLGQTIVAFVTGEKIFANVVAGTVGTHCGSITRKAEAAISLKHALVTQGTADDEVALCGASDIPLGVVPTTCAIDESVPVELLGGNGSTIVGIASEAITAGERVFAAASGKLQDLPAGAGTYYQVGIALTAAAADGDEIEIMPTSPVAVVVA